VSLHLHTTPRVSVVDGTMRRRSDRKKGVHEAGIPDVWGRHAREDPPFHHRSATTSRPQRDHNTCQLLSSSRQSNAFEADILGSIIANLLSNLSKMGSGDLEEHCAALKQVNYTNFVFSL
jgi:hypothetical protein